MATSEGWVTYPSAQLDSIAVFCWLTTQTHRVLSSVVAVEADLCDYFSEWLMVLAFRIFLVVGMIYACV